MDCDVGSGVVVVGLPAEVVEIVEGVEVEEVV